jgi:hypothetical protein
VALRFRRMWWKVFSFYFLAVWFGLRSFFGRKRISYIPSLAQNRQDAWSWFLGGTGVDDANEREEGIHATMFGVEGASGE